MNAHQFGNIAQGDSFTALRATRHELAGLDKTTRQIISDRLNDIIQDVVATTQAPVTAVILEIIREASFHMSVVARTIGRAEGIACGRLTTRNRVPPKPSSNDSTNSEVAD
jgi:hypothetical protein